MNRYSIPTHRPFIADEELQAVRKVFDSRWLGMGSATKKFEQELSKFLGTRHVIAVNSGTAALHLALLALDLKPGDEVIVPSLTFTASVQAIIVSRLVPVFCEVFEDTLNIDVTDVPNRITNKTRVVMPVHYGGGACRMEQLLQLAGKYNLHVIEDTAQAFGSTYKGRMAGTFGDVGCFSFDPIKNITCGGGGAVVTNDDKIAHRVKLKRYLGINRSSWKRASADNTWYYEVVTEGYRYHMNDLNAAIGLEQLKRFQAFKARKQVIVQRYDRAFSQIRGLKLIKRNPEETFPFGYFVRVLNGQRDSMMVYLREKGITTMVQFIPNHLHRLFAKPQTRLPVTEQLYKEIVTLPLYFEMTDAIVETVIDEVCSFFCKSSSSDVRAQTVQVSNKKQKLQTNDSIELPAEKT